jgi:hypothetical protein
MKRIKPWWFVNLLGAVMAAPFVAWAVIWLATGHFIFNSNTPDCVRAFISAMLAVFVFAAADNMKANAEKKNDN